MSFRKNAEAEIIKLNDEMEATVEQRTQDLKQTMQQLEKSREKLEDLQSFQKALLDNAGAMIVATDEDGVIKFFNPAASLNIGYHETEVIDINTPILFHKKRK